MPETYEVWALTAEDYAMLPDSAQVMVADFAETFGIDVNRVTRIVVEQTASPVTREQVYS